MGFYGNLANVARTTFSFDKTYTTRLEMDIKCPSDSVFLGRYVLLDYDYEDSIPIVNIAAWIRDNYPGANWHIIGVSPNPEDDELEPIYHNYWEDNSLEINNGDYYIVIQGTVKINNTNHAASFDSPLLCRGFNGSLQLVTVLPNETEPAKYSNFSDWYNTHYYIDKKAYNSVGRGWDSTVWQKTYKDNELAYVMIAELNGVVPTIDLTIDPPIWLSNNNELENYYKDLLGGSGPFETYNATFENGQWVYRSAESSTDGSIELQGDYLKIKDSDSYIWNYNKRKASQDPYFDEKEKTNLYYLLHMQRPWKFNIGNLTGLNTVTVKDNEEDELFISYDSSGETYPSGQMHSSIPELTAPDTIKLNLSLPSVGNALKNIKDLLYGTQYYIPGANNTFTPEWKTNINPLDRDDNTNNITYFSETEDGILNPEAFNSVAGALNSIADIIGTNKIKEINTLAENEFIDNENLIYYGTYAELLAKIDENNMFDIVNYENYDQNDSKKRFWYTFIEIDNDNNYRKYKEFEGYPSYNSILLSSIHDLTEAGDLLDDLKGRIEDVYVGEPGELLTFNSDYQFNSIALEGENPIIVENILQKNDDFTNYLPQDYKYYKSSNNQQIKGKYTFEILPDRRIKVTKNGSSQTPDYELYSFDITKYLFTLPELPENYHYFLKGSPEISNVENTREHAKWYIQLYRDDNLTFEIYKGISELNYLEWSGAKIVVSGQALNSIPNNNGIIFSPMIVRGENATEASSKEYSAYDENYVITISHKKINPLIDPPQELHNLKNITVDEYGHVVEANYTDTPLISGIDLLNFNNISSEYTNTSLVPTTNNGKISLYSEEIKINSNPISIDGNDIPVISLYPNIQIEENNDSSNNTQWFSNTKLDIPYNFNYDQISKKLSYDRKTLDFNFINTLEVGPITKDFSWNGGNVKGKNESFEFFPARHNENNKTLLSFRPGNEWIQQATYADGTNYANYLITRHKTQNKLIRKAGNTYNDYNDGEENDVLVYGQIADLQNENYWDTTSDVSINIYPHPEKIKKNEEDEGELKSVFSFKTLSTKVDQAGHLVNIQESNIKLVIEDIMNKWWHTTFNSLKPITPWVGPYTPQLNDSVTSYTTGNKLTYLEDPKSTEFNGNTAVPFGWINPYGIFLIGQLLELYEGESIFDYKYITFRSGVDGDNIWPNGVDWSPLISTQQIKNKIKKPKPSIYNWPYNDGKTPIWYSDHHIIVRYTSGQYEYAVTLRWEKRITNQSTGEGIEGFRVCQNKAWRINTNSGWSTMSTTLKDLNGIDDTRTNWVLPRRDDTIRFWTGLRFLVIKFDKNTTYLYKNPIDGANYFSAPVRDSSGWHAESWKTGIYNSCGSNWILNNKNSADDKIVNPYWPTYHLKGERGDTTHEDDWVTFSSNNWNGMPLSFKAANEPWTTRLSTASSENGISSWAINSTWTGVRQVFGIGPKITSEDKAEWNINEIEYIQPDDIPKDDNGE